MDFALKQFRKSYLFHKSLFVSILVLVDFALKPNWCFIHTRENVVSILVLVDFALKPDDKLIRVVRLISFNPCFGGFCS